MTSFLYLVVLAGCFSILYALKKQHIQLSIRVLVSLLLGAGLGILLFFAKDSFDINSLNSILRLIGDGYLALLKMLVIPLILTSIIHAILNLGSSNAETIRKISITTCIMLLGMTALSSAIGLYAGKLFGVGFGLSMPDIPLTPKHPYTSLVDSLIGMLPSNPVAMMAQENTVAVVIFAVLLGLAARKLDAADHEKMLTFDKWIASLFSIVKKLAVLILGLTPYAVVALISSLIAEQGISVLTGMLNFILAMYAAMIVVMIMHSIVLMMFGYHPIQYFKKAATPLFVAFTTRSSFGTLPVSEETLRTKFKTNPVVATFVPSLGATIGMNACAGVYPAMLVMMVLTMMHQPLTLSMALTVMFVNAVASIGISGIPGTAYIAATVTLTSMNLPFAVIALVQGIDPIIDMGRTAVNVNGALVTALTANRLISKEN